ncbi:WD40 repeat domain-containing protein (plasmid) [Streptomyces longwoodensis]|uniref:WD40 repeat domain-containing protein n=1 Tax=Streptomyces longwoodensis TaxID=68231 RepID=UPI002F90D08E
MRESAVARAMAALAAGAGGPGGDAREWEVAELLDALLLAAASSAGEPADQRTAEPQDGTDERGPYPEGASDLGPHPPKHTPAPGHGSSSSSREAAASVWLKDDDGAHTIPGKRLSAGRASPLPDSLGIGRALRPLRRPWPSKVRRRLDVDATVEHYTHTGMLIPRLAPASEPWLEAVVVLDHGTAMAVWDESVRALTKLLRALAAFRDVRVWHLDHPPGAIPVLRDQRGRTRPMDPSDPGHTQPPRRLLLLVSDCAAPAWRGNALWQTVYTWGRTAPVALINPLPKHLWQRSGLDLPRTTATAPAPASPGRQLSFRRPRLFRENIPGTRPWQALPVLPLEAAQVLAWSRTLMRTDPAGCEAVLVPATGRVPLRSRRSSAAPRPDMAPAARDFTDDAHSPAVAAAARAFTDDAHSPAVRLAVAASPLDAFTLPVLDVLRERLVPDAGVADTAEFLTAGLLTATRPDTSDTGTRSGSPDTVYRFHPSAAEHLRSLLSRDQAWDAHFALTDHLAAHPQSPHGIAAALRFPDSHEALPTGLRPFAQAAAATARLLGVEPTEPLQEPAPAEPQHPEQPQQQPQTQPQPEQPQLPERHVGPVWDVAVSTDGSRTATAGEDGNVFIWDTITGELVHVLTGHTSAVTCLAFSPNGNVLVTASQDRTVRRWHPGTGVLLDVHSGTERVRALAHSPDGAFVAVADSSGFHRLEGEDLLDVPVRGSWPTSLAFSPDGTHLASGLSTNEVLLWQVDGQNNYMLMNHDSPVTSVAFSPDGTRLATSDAIGTVRVWDPKTLKQLLHIITGIVINAVAFSPDGSEIATAGEDGTVRIRNASTGAERSVLTQLSAVNAIAYTPDGTRIATACADGTTDFVRTGTTSVTLEQPVPDAGTDLELARELALVDILPDRVRMLIHRAFDLLDRHGTLPGASFMLRPLLGRSDLTPDEARHAVSLALRWLDANASTHQTDFVLSSLLRRRDLTATQFLTAASYTFFALDRLATSADASFLLEALISREDLREPYAREAMVRAFDWLQVNLSTLEARYVLGALIDRAAYLPETDRRNTVALALRWLRENSRDLDGEELPTARCEAAKLLYGMLTLTRLDDTEAHEIIRSALWWLTRNALLTEAAPTLGVLLAHKRLGEALHDTVSLAMSYLQMHPDHPDSSYVLRSLLESKRLTPVEQRQAFHQAFKWLEAHGSNARTSFVLAPLLANTRLTGTDADRAIALALRWLELKGNSSDASFILQQLLFRWDVTGLDTRAAVAFATTWLERHLLAPGSFHVLVRLLQRTDLTSGEADRALRFAFAWMDAHGGRPEAAHILSALLGREDLSPLNVERALRLCVDWLDIDRPRTGEARLLSSLLESPSLTHAQADTAAGHALHWLERRLKRSDHQNVLIALLNMRDLDEDRSRHVVRLTTDWIASAPDDYQTGFLLAPFVTHPALSASERLTTVLLCQTWLRLHVTVRRSRLVLAALLSLPELPPTESRDTIAMAFRWLHLHASDPVNYEKSGASEVLRPLLHHPDLTPPEAAQAEHFLPMSAPEEP